MCMCAYDIYIYVCVCVCVCVYLCLYVCFLSQESVIFSRFLNGL